MCNSMQNRATIFKNWQKNRILDLIYVKKFLLDIRTLDKPEYETEIKDYYHKSEVLTEKSNPHFL